MRSTGPIQSLLAAALAALAMVVMPPDDVAAQDSGVIQGKIVEVTTKQPMAGVQILVTGTQRGTLTDANGLYRIPDVPAGEREVRVMSIGFASQTKTVRVTAAQPVVADFELKQQVIDLDEIVVTGVAGQSTRGKIVELEDGPVPAILEYITTAPSTQRASSAGRCAAARCCAPRRPRARAPGRRHRRRPSRGS